MEDSLLVCSSFENSAKRLECVDNIILSLVSQPIIEPEKSESPQESNAQISSVDESSENGLAQKDLQELQEAANQTSSSYELIAVFKDKKETLEL